MEAVGHPASWKSSERQFDKFSDKFCKRSLRPDEYMIKRNGEPYVPPKGYERLKNEAASLQFIREKTNIPVPEVLEAYDDRGAFVLVTKLLPGVQMCKLSAEQQIKVMEEVEAQIKVLQSIKSSRTGGPTGIVCPPPRATRWFPKGTVWSSTTPKEPDLVFCHCDLSQTNILVDPETLSITGIIDWEFSGFWPDYFEAPYFRDPRPSGAQFVEPADNVEVVDFLERQGHKVEATS
ncbi:uncharacterized protein PpBr36_11011 [Pyricularia pennisetigena]|uniref:uncharacterized protein n=1 Tax=Pyricularia pennisetigena TaxID=1578925 RepID=UPI0011519567|nr:uncharacterized protein PpBr36_11011 [Pyricularia pennisetigena]TLS20677.1 hypothetical protein PpBr36_11011 [Pyricularia pennisetigena]